jgi:fido (protein-threonine AMPylation protein)
LDALHVAAYVLWKINWIHPFDEGNGRTARAAMYYALSLKLERMLPGSISIPAQLRKQPRLYYQHLATIDASVKDTGHPNLDPLAAYLGKLLDRQLQS